jgi:hypothetical protein
MRVELSVGHESGARGRAAVGEEGSGRRSRSREIEAARRARRAPEARRARRTPCVGPPSLSPRGRRRTGSRGAQLQPAGAAAAAARHSAGLDKVPAPRKRRRERPRAPRKDAALKKKEVRGCVDCAAGGRRIPPPRQPPRSGGRDALPPSPRCAGQGRPARRDRRTRARGGVGGRRRRGRGVGRKGGGKEREGIFRHKHSPDEVAAGREEGVEVLQVGEVKGQGEGHLGRAVVWGECGEQSLMIRRRAPNSTPHSSPPPAPGPRRCSPPPPPPSPSSVS